MTNRKTHVILAIFLKIDFEFWITTIGLKLRISKKSLSGTQPLNGIVVLKTIT